MLSREQKHHKNAAQKRWLPSDFTELAKGEYWTHISVVKCVVYSYGTWKCSMEQAGGQ